MEEDDYSKELQRLIDNAPNTPCQRCYEATYRFYRNCIERGVPRQACEEDTRIRQRACDQGPCRQ